MSRFVNDDFSRLGQGWGAPSVGRRRERSLGGVAPDFGQVSASRLLTPTSMQPGLWSALQPSSELARRRGGLLMLKIEVVPQVR